MRWLRIAAEGGEPRAMLLYGTALYNGDGVAPDPVTRLRLSSAAPRRRGSRSPRRRSPTSTRRMPLAQRKKGLALAKTMVAATAARPTPGRRRRRAPVAGRAKAAAPRTGRTPPPRRQPSSGNWRIQLGAFGQRATAEALFARLRGKLGARQAFYVPAGKVTRLQVGPYPSRAAAAAACAALAGQACFPVAAR